MSMKSLIMTTTGAAAGMILGNYLYETDKKVNEGKETPVPFYTVRKAAEDIGKKAEETYNDIKDKIYKKKKEETATEEVADSTVETVEKVEAEVIEAEKEDNNEIDESKVIDVEVVGDKAVPADQENKEETVETKAEENTGSVEPIIPAAEEAKPAKFTIVDAPAAPAETQAPVTKETGTTKKSSTTKRTTKKAEQ